jgi:hypothetical protein
LTLQISNGATPSTGAPPLLFCKINAAPACAWVTSG